MTSTTASTSSAHPRPSFPHSEWNFQQSLGDIHCPSTSEDENSNSGGHQCHQQKTDNTAHSPIGVDKPHATRDAELPLLPFDNDSSALNIVRQFNGKTTPT